MAKLRALSDIGLKAIDFAQTNGLSVSTELGRHNKTTLIVDDAAVPLFLEAFKFRGIYDTCNPQNVRFRSWRTGY